MRKTRLSRVFLSLPVLLLLLDGCVSQDAQYTRRDINNLQKQIDALRQDITTTRTPTPPEPSGQLATEKEQADLTAEMETLKRDVSSLRAIIEDHENLTATTAMRLDDQEKRLTTRIEGLESRLDQLLVKAEEGPVETAPPAPPVKVPEAEAPPTADAEEAALWKTPSSQIASDVEKVYREAYETFQQDDLEEAKTKFLAFLEKYPDTSLSDNAQFWIGEIAYKRHQYEAAILAYENVIKKYPDSNKLPDAILKQGLAFLELGDKIDARIILENLVKKYPQTEQAKTASEKLKALK